MAISKREIRSYLDNPASYVVLIVFLLLWEFLFFRSVFLVGVSSLQGLFDLFPFLALILVPAVTMGSLSKERDDGTLELILTHPVRELEFVAGKFLGAFAFVAAAVLFSLPISVEFGKYGHLDYGAYAGQFVGALLLVGSLISLGIFVSGLFTSQIAALLVSISAGFLLTVSGSEIITVSAPSSILNILEQLSLGTHFQSISRGVIDVRDLWYFISLIGSFLGLAYFTLLRRKYGNNRQRYKNFQVIMALFVGIAVLSNILGARIPGRLDLTQNKIYSLSDATVKTIQNLSDVVNITLYASGHLPSQYSPILRETRDILREYKNLSKGNVTLTIKDPSEDAQVEQEALSQGIQQVQFNVIGKEELQLKTGFLGLVISYGGQSERVPFIRSASDLEYQLTGFIKKLTSTQRSSVAFLTGHGEKDALNGYSIFSQELQKQFNVQTTVDLATADVLIIAGPTGDLGAKTLDDVTKFMEAGKGVFILADKYVTDQNLTGVYPIKSDIFDLLSKYGVTVEDGIVYDLRSNETVRFGDGTVNYLLPYPFWVRALVLDQKSPVVLKLNTATFTWASPISVLESVLSERGYKYGKLLGSTKFAGLQKGQINIAPNQNFSTDNLRDYVLAYSIEGSVGRFVVTGDSEMLLDQVLQNSPENLVFGLNVVSWLGAEESLAGIKIKSSSLAYLNFDSPQKPASIKYSNMFLALVLPFAVGASRLLRRRFIKDRTYEES